MIKIKKLINKYIFHFIILRKIRSIFFKINRKPLFILGNPKSGTTIIGKLISKASNKSHTSDIRSVIKNSSEKLDLGLININTFINSHKYEFSKEIIKEPSLSFYAEELINEYPNSKFIWIIRNPLQNIRSILNRLKIDGNHHKIKFEDYDEINKNPAWKYNLEFRKNNKKFFYIEALAYRWNFLANLYFKNKDKIQLVKYEDFIINKKKYINNLLNTIQINKEKDIDEMVDTQFQPKGNSNIDINKFFGKKNKELILKICEKNMKKLNYL
ncbi:MAG: hypothetical protein CMD09_04880 [Flavobacteriales bacterium]|nr:hypothetical protein [Flavobacteriales bacterium]